jgi:hypothetical protein
LKIEGHTCGNIAGHEGWDAYPEIDKHAAAQLSRDPFGDDDLSVHCTHPFATRKSTKVAGVTT